MNGQQNSINSGYIPPNGFVPNDTAAIKIAEAVWLPIYGEKIYSERPFVATLDTLNGIWTVRGSLPPSTLSIDSSVSPSFTMLELVNGGTAVIKLQKSDGKVLFVLHYK